MNLYEIFNATELFDSHAHLTYLEEQGEIDKQVKNAQSLKLEFVMNMGIDYKSSKKAINQAKDSNNYLKAFVGIDPEVFQPGSSLFVGLKEGEKYIDLEIQKIESLIKNNHSLIAGIGETGMDYYHLEHAKELSVLEKDESKKLQKELFTKHLELASKYNLPLSIHSRWAEAECLEIVNNYKCLGIFHSYTGDYKTAKSILDAGWGLGVNGISTFKNANAIRELYKKLLGRLKTNSTPLDFYKNSIFFETDSPFLSPEGKRGATNEPANVKLVFEHFINFLFNN